jgi:hypothetical protein
MKFNFIALVLIFGFQSSLLQADELKYDLVPLGQQSARELLPETDWCMVPCEGERNQTKPMYPLGSLESERVHEATPLVKDPFTMKQIK